MEVNSYLNDLRENNIIPFINNAATNPKKAFKQQFITIESKRL